MSTRWRRNLQHHGFRLEVRVHMELGHFISLGFQVSKFRMITIHDLLGLIEIKKMYYWLGELYCLQLSYASLMALKLKRRSFFLPSEITRLYPVGKCDKLIKPKHFRFSLRKMLILRGPAFTPLCIFFRARNSMTPNITLCVSERTESPSSLLPSRFPSGSKNVSQPKVSTERSRRNIPRTWPMYILKSVAFLIWQGRNRFLLPAWKFGDIFKASHRALIFPPPKNALPVSSLVSQYSG